MTLNTQCILVTLKLTASAELQNYVSNRQVDNAAEMFTSYLQLGMSETKILEKHTPQTCSYPGLPQSSKCQLYLQFSQIKIRHHFTPFSDIPHLMCYRTLLAPSSQSPRSFLLLSCPLLLLCPSNDHISPR